MSSLRLFFYSWLADVLAALSMRGGSMATQLRLMVLRETMPQYQQVDSRPAATLPKPQPLVCCRCSARSEFSEVEQTPYRIPFASGTLLALPAYPWAPPAGWGKLAHVAVGGCTECDAPECPAKPSVLCPACDAQVTGELAAVLSSPVGEA